jgi:DNA-binding beta-propeller fold protein YncE
LKAHLRAFTAAVTDLQSPTGLQFSKLRWRRSNSSPGDPDLSAIFTGNMTSKTIGIFQNSKDADASGWTEINIPLSKAPEGFDISPDGKELWAASHQEMVTIIDIGTKKVVQSINVHSKFANRLKFTLDSKHVLISDLGNGDLIVVDAASRKEVKRVSLGHGGRRYSRCAGRIGCLYCRER